MMFASTSTTVFLNAVLALYIVVCLVGIGDCHRAEDHEESGLMTESAGRRSRSVRSAALGSSASDGGSSYLSPSSLVAGSGAMSPSLLQQAYAADPSAFVIRQNADQRRSRLYIGKRQRDGLQDGDEEADEREFVGEESLVALLERALRLAEQQQQQLREAAARLKEPLVVGGARKRSLA